MNNNKNLSGDYEMFYYATPLLCLTYWCLLTFTKDIVNMPLTLTILILYTFYSCTYQLCLTLEYTEK